MSRLTKWSALALVGVLLAADFADACGRRGRRGRRGGGDCCHSSGHGHHHAGGHSGYYHGGQHHGGHGGYYDSQGRYSAYPRDEGYEGTGDRFGAIQFRSAPGAKIWVNDQLIEGTGATRTWRSPAALQSGQSYNIRAQWTEDGKQMNQTRSVTVQPGRRATVDFTRPQDQQDRPETRPQDRPEGLPQGTPQTQPKSKQGQQKNNPDE